MAKTAQQIADDIYDYLGDRKDYSSFYIGITNNIERRLFNEHQVSQTVHWWIYCNATNKDAAQAVEEHFLGIKMKGDTGGGDKDSTWVYCYEISLTTKE